jgi:hypothetical protein
MHPKSRQNLYFKLVLCGIIFAVIAQIVHSIGVFLSLRYYQSPDFSQVFNPLMISQQGPPPSEFILLALVFGIIQGVFVSYLYLVLKKGVPGKTVLHKGLIYGNIIFIITTVSGSFAMILMVNLPLAIVGAWAVENLITYLLSGMIIAKLLD